MGREGELKAAEKRSLEEGQVTRCFAIFQPWFSITTRVWYFGGEMKRNRLCYKQVFVIMKPLQSMRSELGCVPK